MTADAAATAASGAVLLVADDFAMTGGISAGIESLARNGRLSAASAIVTLPRWRRDAAALRGLRDRIATGLHVNLTLGAPLAPMPLLAPRGALPPIGTLTRHALLPGRSRGALRAEIEAEIARQIAAFEAAMGHPPDMVDGHQHAHALPLVREALLGALARRFPQPGKRPLVRVPTDTARAIARRGSARVKAAAIAGLTAGFGSAVSAAGFPANGSFAGISDFGIFAGDVSRDLEAALVRRARLHLVMCHPGVPTRELDGLDRLTGRRAAELAVLGADNVLTPLLWRPRRTTNDAPIDWRPIMGPGP